MADQRKRDNGFRFNRERQVKTSTRKYSVRFHCTRCNCWSRTITVGAVQRCTFCLVPLAEGFIH